MRALFGAVAEAVERARDDLRERAGIGAVGPQMPTVRRRRAEDGDVDGVPEGDASQLVAGTVWIWPLGFFVRKGRIAATISMPAT